MIKWHTEDRRLHYAEAGPWRVEVSNDGRGLWFIQFWLGSIGFFKQHCGTLQTAKEKAERVLVALSEE